MTCTICKDAGYVHPRIDGKILYDRTIYCQCQGKKSGGIAASPLSEAEIAQRAEESMTALYDYLQNLSPSILTPVAPEEEHGTPQPLWSRGQWQQVQQLQALTGFVLKKLGERTKQKRKGDNL